MGSTLLTSKAVILAGLQSAIGTPATLSAATDALLSSEPDFSVDVNVLERKFTSADLSPFKHLIGRKIASIKFKEELRGNGKQQSGVLTDAPRISRLLQACGYDLIAMTGDAANVSPVVPDSKNPGTTPTITWVAGGSLGAGMTKPVLYTITKGATTAITITNNDNVTDNLTGAAATIASGTPLTLSTASGITLTPTFTGSIPTGAVFRVLVLPKGLKLKPISTGQKPITVEAYFDGLKHKVHDAFGTFSISAEAGGYASLDFTFTGQFNQTVDAALPAAVFETQVPQQVELANLTWGSAQDLIVQQFTYDQKNTITPRPDVNSPDGYKGVRISARAPEGGVNPEAMLVAEGDFWGDFATAQAKHFVMQVGTTVGNQVVLQGPQVQTNDLGYGDRDGIRNFDLGLMFKRLAGDDEFMIYFC